MNFKLATNTLVIFISLSILDSMVRPLWATPLKCENLFFIAGNNNLPQINFKQPSLEQIRDYVMGVHVTNFLPDNWILKSSIPRGMGFRPTVHFALGEMVRSHEMGIWENSKYAILVPFQYLEGQLLNVFHQDTFILGDLKLQKGTILIAPRSETIPITDEIEIIYYDQKAQTLRKKVEQVLQERKKWLFTSSGGHDYDKVSLNSTVLDQQAFFKSILDQYKYVTFGLHATHPTGKIDHFMHINFGIFKDPTEYVDQNYINWMLKLKQIRIYLKEVDNLAKKLNLSPDVRWAYKVAKLKFQHKINIFLAEISLQKRHQKTLLGTKNLPLRFLNEIKSLSKNLKALSDFLDRNISLFSTKSEFDKEFFAYDLALLREYLKESEFIDFLKSDPEILIESGGLEYQLNVRRITKINSVQMLKKHLKQTLITSNHQESRIFLMKLLSPELPFDKNLIINDPEVSANLNQYFDLKAFTHLKQKDSDIKSWIWFARELKLSHNRKRLWNDGLQIYGFIEIE